MEKGNLKLLQTNNQRIQALHAGQIVEVIDRYQIFEITSLESNPSASGKKVRTASEYFNLEGGKVYGTVLPLFHSAIVQDANDTNG